MAAEQNQTVDSTSSTSEPRLVKQTITPDVAREKRKQKHESDQKTSREVIVEENRENTDKPVSDTSSTFYGWFDKFRRKFAYPDTKCLHELFTEQALKTPNNIAVIGEGKKYTFREIDELTDKLANKLTSFGVQTADTIGIFSHKCCEYVMAYIAIHKAGGAYLPLEIAYPPPLLANVLEDCSLKVVLTLAKYADRLPTSQTKFCLDEGWHEGIMEVSERKNPAPPTPDSPAYVVCSSGTTGKPKLMQCPHRGAVHSYHWRSESYPYREGDVEGCNIFFVWECLRSLLRGYPVVVIPDDVIYDAALLRDFVDGHKITRMLFTPSLLQTCLDDYLKVSESSNYSNKGLMPSLRLIVLCGEVVTSELAKRCRDMWPEAVHLNLYSISECHDVSDIDLAKYSTSTKYAAAGHIIPNVGVHILDENKKPVPLGVTGRVHVSGPTLAVGYLHQPKLNAERFFQWTDPTNPDAKSVRVYDTGDTGLFLPDGVLEILGREDSMVKIRGYSVELGAVEVALVEHPLISAGVVITEGAEGEDKKLIGYFVRQTKTEELSVNSLREYLLKKLPHYAVPNVFVELEALPLSDTTGKCDRKKLPKTDAVDPSTILKTVASTVKPNTETERRLVKIWGNLLEVQNIGITDNFFEVGGHSLIGTQLVSHIKDELKVHLLVKDIFQYPVLKDIAKFIDSKNADVEMATEPAIDFAAECKLEENLHLNSDEASAILLTGATGYFGGFLLTDLLKQTTEKIYCLVRCTSTEGGLQRIMENIKKQNDFECSASLQERIVIIPSDLSQHRFGLTQTEFDRLSQTVGHIIHCGAVVNFLLPYEKLKPTNVNSTKEVIRLASSSKHRPIPISYISTLGVFPYSSLNDKDSVKWHETSPLPKDATRLADAYCQGKWVSEKILEQAKSQGLNVNIFRCGDLCAGFRSRVWNQNDFYYMFLSSCIAIGAFPEIPDMVFELTSVEFASAAVLKLLNIYNTQFHLIAEIRIPFPDLIDLFTTLRPALRTLPWEQWKNALSNRQEEFSSLWSLMQDMTMDGLQTYSRTQFRCEITKRLLDEQTLELNCHIMSTLCKLLI